MPILWRQYLLLFIGFSYFTLNNGLKIIENTEQQVAAGVTKQISINLDFTGDNIIEGNTIDVLVTFNSNGQGCAPSSENTIECTDPKPFRVSNVKIESKNNVLIPVDLGQPIDYSLVNQYLKVEIEIENPKISTGNVQVTDFITGAAPIVSGGNNVLVAGDGGSTSLSIVGSGFSRFITHIHQVEIRAKQENGLYFKPTLKILESTEKTIKFSITTSCNGKNANFLDLSLVGNQLVLTSLTIFGSELKFSKAVDISSTITGTEIKPVLVEKINEKSTSFQLTGSFFSCNMNATLVKLYSSTEVGSPPVAVITEITENSLRAEFSSCNGTLPSIDSSMSGSVLRAKIIIKSLVEQESELIDISDVLTFSKPTLLTQPFEALSGTAIDSLKLQGTGFSCVPSLNQLSLTSSKDSGVVPNVKMIAATPTELEFSLETCNGSLNGIDNSMIGSALLGQLEIESKESIKSEVFTLTNEIKGDQPLNLDVSNIQLKTGISNVTLSGTGFSCFPKFNDVELISSSGDFVLPSIMIANTKTDEVKINFISCQDQNILDATMAGKELKIKVTLKSSKPIETNELQFKNIQGSLPSIDLDVNIGAGDENAEFSGSGFSCDPKYNRINFSLSSRRLGASSAKEKESNIPIAKVTSSSYDSLKFDLLTTVGTTEYKGLDYSLIGKQLTTVVSISTDPVQSSSPVTLPSITGEAPLILENRLEICLSSIETEPIEIAVDHISFDPTSSSVEAFINSTEKLPNPIKVQNIIQNQTGVFMQIVLDNSVNFPTDLSLQITNSNSGLISKQVQVGVIKVCSSDNNTGDGPNNNGTDSSKEHSAGLSGGAIAGIVIGVVAVCGFAVEFFVLAKKRKKNDDLSEGFVDSPMEELGTEASGAVTPKESIVVI